MRLAKLETLVIEPVMDGKDIGSFMEEIHKKGNSMVTAVSSDTAASDPPIEKQHEDMKKGFQRLADFINAREKSSPRILKHQSKKALSLAAYKRQQNIFAGAKPKKLLSAA